MLIYHIHHLSQAKNIIISIHKFIFSTNRHTFDNKFSKPEITKVKQHFK